jgi:hypothetical protein
MTSGHRPLVATMLLAAAGCRAAPQAAPVPLEGSHAELAALAGVWAGRYWSEASGRRGTIAFRLRAGADTAHGEVEMTFSPTLRLYGAKPPADGVPEAPAPCTTIHVAVRAHRGGADPGDPRALRGAAAAMKPSPPTLHSPAIHSKGAMMAAEPSCII